MCCTQKALKISIYVSTAIILGVGAILIWTGYLVQSSPLVSTLSFTYAGYIVTGCGGFLIFVAFIGMIGAWKQKRCLLGLFIVCTIVVGVLLICFGSILIYLRSVSDEYLHDESACMQHFVKQNNVSVQAAPIFCTMFCPCTLNTEELGITPSGFYRGSADNMMECDPCEIAATYSDDQQQELIVWVNTTLKVDLNGTNCSLTSVQFESNYFSPQQINYFPLLTWMETKFVCSGLCTKQELLMFSSPNLGVPDKPCYSLINSWAKQNFLNYGIISIILGSFQLFVLIFASSLCCCARASNLQLSEPNSNSKTHKTKDDTEEIHEADHSEIEIKTKKSQIDFETLEVVKKSKLRTPYSRKP